MRNKIYLKYALSFRTLSGSAGGNKEIQIRVSIQRIQQIVKSSRKKKKAGENESQKIYSKISQNSGFEFEIETSAVLRFVAQSCLTLQPHDCSPQVSSVHGDSPGKNTGVGYHALLQGVFSTQGSNPGLLNCRQILYHRNHQGSPRILQ